MLCVSMLPIAASSLLFVSGLVLQDASSTAVQDAPPAEAAAKATAAEDEGVSPRISTESDWAKWERMGRTALSPDGRWVAYTVRLDDDTNELRLRVVATDSTEVFEHSTNPEFSSDGKWLAYEIGKSADEREALKKKKKPVVDDLGLFDLVGGERDSMEGVSGFEFSADGAFLAIRRASEKGDKNGADLIVREMATGTDTHFGRVGSFAWSDEGAWLAMTIDAPDRAGNGVRVVDAATGVLRTLESDDADFIGLTWREDAADIAVMSKREYEDEEDATFSVLAFQNVAAAKPKTIRYDHLKDESFPEGMRVVDFEGLRWSDDGAALFFGLKAWDKKPEALTHDDDEDADSDSGEESAEPGDAKEQAVADESEKPKDEDSDESEEEETKSLRDSLDEAPGVEIWHAKDINIIPRQKRTQSSDERDSMLAALWLDGARLVQLEDEQVDDVILLEGHRRGVGVDETPYIEEQRFSATVADVYSVDLMTGDRNRILERVKYTAEGDPTGRRVLYVRDDHVWSFDLATSQTQNLTEGVDTPFINQENSSLTDQKPMYGVAGWLKDGSGVLLNSRYDIWSFSFDGGEPEALTQGAAKAIRHRLVRVAADPDDDEFVDLEAGFYVSLYGDTTKQSGYAHFSENAGLKQLLWADSRISRLRQAEDAPVLTYIEERFDDSPDVFATGPDLDKPTQISATNAFSSEFMWGHSELVDYESAGGDPLQGALFYPADYDPKKTYPMIVYIYELRSQSLHQYQAPTEQHPYNTSVFTQGGYFVFQPDIVYRAQNPGLSAVDCVVPAVRKVLESGKVDPERVGLMGHSWGAYQTAFIVTQTDLFAAGVAGAPLTNMMSMSMSIYWNSGQTDAYIFHESQGRMDRPFWRDLDTYIANSPIFSIEQLNTPLLVAFGDNDGAVDWQQGVEMYNAARLAQRPYVMLVYPGENHGLAKKPNKVDYHHRVREWFDTHLTGEEAPLWITDGLPWLEQKKALEAIGSKGSKKEAED